jgi:glycosyltransferase involved in cell wall biosynthesis
MTITLINTSDRTGGAALACNSLFKALQVNNVNVRFLVRDKTGIDDLIKATAVNLSGKIRGQVNFWHERSQFIPYAKSREYWFLFSPANTGENILHHEILESADIIHIHWINSGFLSLGMLDRITSLGKPVVFTLHDMWLFTGGCHHAFNCTNFHKGCGNCFMLRNPGPEDLSRKGFKIKKAFLEKENIHFVTVSNWLKNRFLESGLNIDENRIKVIPNVIDTELFKPIPRAEACSCLGITQDARYVAFGAQNLRSPLKGLNHLVPALNHLKYLLDKQNNKNVPEPKLLLFGKYNGNIQNLAASIPLEIKYLGIVSNQNLLTAIYSAADFTVVPSLYETFGQVVAESLSCGTPAIAFKNSGPTEIIQHLETGYLAPYESGEGLAEGMLWGLGQESNSSIRKECRQSVIRKYSSVDIANQHIKLYRDLLQAGKE